MTDASERVERELTLLVRRALRSPLLGAEDGPGLDRAAYTVLGRLHDDGPQRVSALATLLELDPSTVSRQVQALCEAGLVGRGPDPRDRRAARVEPTAEGTRLLLAVRARRRAFLHDLLADWPADDRERFATLLARFNGDVTSRLPQAATPAAASPAASPAAPTLSRAPGGPRP